jgi:hypothetical protein
MSTPLLALPASVALLALLASKTPPQTSNPAVAAALSHFAQIPAMESAALIDVSGRSSRRPVGLGKARLQTSSLQPASGLQSAAGGLLSEEEWRLIFPKREAP